jgi:hypothetical protein
VPVDQCVSAVRAVEVTVLVCLCSSSSHVTEARGAVRFVKLTLKVVMKNYGDFVDVILLYLRCVKNI